MTIVCRLGSNTAGSTPKFARILASSRAAARASGDMLSAPAIGSAASLAPLCTPQPPRSSVALQAQLLLDVGEPARASVPRPQAMLKVDAAEALASASAHSAAACSPSSTLLQRERLIAGTCMPPCLRRRAYFSNSKHLQMSRALYHDRTISLTRSAVS
jgi:hypothetical protein